MESIDEMIPISLKLSNEDVNIPTILDAKSALGSSILSFLPPRKEFSITNGCIPVLELRINAPDPVRRLSVTLS